MTQATGAVLVIAIVIVAAIAPLFTAQPPTADQYIEKDRTSRQLTFMKPRKSVTPKWGFFGTILNLILEQTNETKSAYNQVSDLLSAQFVSDNEVTEAPEPTNNGTTAAPKISRSEFLKIVERNVKGLNLLRNKEWRQAKKDTMANFRQYRDEIFGIKKT